MPELMKPHREFPFKLTKVKWKKICRRIGIRSSDKLSLLGVGCYSRVFDDGNRVIKFCRGESDARTALYFYRNPHPMVAPIEKVFQINKEHSYYCIVQEKMTLPRGLWGSFNSKVNFNHPRNSLEEIKTYWFKSEKEQYEKQIAWLKDFVKFCQETGYRGRDLHAANMMFHPKRKHLVITDVGRSTASRYKKEYKMPVQHTSEK